MNPRKQKTKKTREVEQLALRFSFFTVTLAMQTLLPPAARAGRFTAVPPAVPLTVSAVSSPRLRRSLYLPNSLLSLPLKLTRSSPPSFGSFIAPHPWKLPFTVTSASSQVSPASTPSNDESEKAKLDQVHYTHTHTLSLSWSLFYSLYLSITYQ